MELKKNMLSLKKDNLFSKIKNNYKIIIFFLLLFFFSGCLYSGFTYRNQYQSSATIYYRSYAPDSYIEQMASVVSEKEVYTNTIEQLKKEQVYIYQSLDYDEKDIQKIIKVTTNISLHLVNFVVDYEEKDTSQIICETFLDNAFNHVKMNPLFKSNVLIMNHATTPKKYNNKIPQKLLLFSVAGLCVGLCNCFIKEKYNPTIGTMSALFNLGVNSIIPYDRLSAIKVAKEMELVNQRNLKDICIYVESVQLLKSLQLIKNISEQLGANKKMAIVYIGKPSKKERKKIQLFFSDISDNSNSKIETFIFSTLDLVENSESHLQNGQFEIVFWVIENCEKQDFENIKTKINIFIVKKGVTDLKLFIEKYNKIMQEDVQPIIIYQ